MASLRPIIPRGATLSYHSAQLRHHLLPTLTHPTHRTAATTTPPPPPPPKPRLLEKPLRFNPPSHGARLPRSSRTNRYPGAPLTSEQRTRRYPHMFPSEGTWTFWFLTSRILHVCITLSILVSLVIAVQVGEFLRTTPYADLLPPRSMFLAHPGSWLGRYWEVYRMHVDWVSRETAERRRQRVEDVRKRSEYRRAHGMDDEGVFGGWTAKSDAQVMGPGMREGGEVSGLPVIGAEGQVGERVAGEELAKDEYVDFEGNRQRTRKRWFGIW